MPRTEEGLQEGRCTRVGIHCYRLIHHVPENLRHCTGNSLGPREELKDNKPWPPGLALWGTLSPGPHLPRPAMRLPPPRPPLHGRSPNAAGVMLLLYRSTNLLQVGCDLCKLELTYPSRAECLYGPQSDTMTSVE